MVALIAFYCHGNIASNRVLIIGMVNVLTIALAVLTFAAFINVNKEIKGLKNISKCTLLVYLLHPMVIHIFYGLFKLNPLRYNLILSIPFTTLCIFVSTLLISMIIEFVIKLIGSVVLKRGRSE
jgi:surface polysaccharide O-acyltransferase-like enzyme